MANVLRRPNRDLVNGGSIVTGAASRHAALSDDSDASYVTVSGGRAEVGFPIPVVPADIPADAKVKSIVIVARLRKSGPPNGALRVTLQSTTDAWDLPLAQATLNVTWANPTNVFALTLNGPMDALPASDLILGLWLASGGNQRIYELYALVFYVEPPVPTVNAPADGSTVVDVTSPTVSWTSTFDADGGVPNLAQVKVFTQAQYTVGGFDPETSDSVANSGVLASGDGSWTVPAALAAGLHRAYVKTAQYPYSNWSAWSHSTFTMDVVRPGTPTSFTVTPSDPDAWLELLIECDPAGDATTDFLEIQRRESDGSWTDLRTVAGNGLVVPDLDEAFGIDAEVPNGALTTYRVRALHDYGSAYAVSDWVEASGTWSSDLWWIKHPVRPDLNMAITVRSFPTKTRASRQGSFEVRGRSDPIVVTDGDRSYLLGAIVFRLDSDAEKAALDALLDEDQPLLLQFPAGQHEADRWWRFGDEERTRMVDAAWMEREFATYPLTEVARPSRALEFVSELAPSDFLYPADSLYP